MNIRQSGWSPPQLLRSVQASLAGDRRPRPAGGDGAGRMQVGDEEQM